MNKIKLKEFIRFVYSELRNKPIEVNVTDMQGLGGDILFLLYYNKFIEKEDLLETKIIEITKLLKNKKFKDFSLGDGLTGLMFALQLYRNESESNDFNSLIEYDTLVLSLIEKDVENYNYDFLYGLIGKYLYQLERHPEKINHKNIHDNIIGISKLVGGFRIWLDSSNGMDEEYINLGLAHGIPSILCLYIKLYKISKASIYLETINEIVKLLIYIFKNTSNNKYENTFPSFISIKTGKAEYLKRNAWCYGDLGILFPLLELKNMNVLKDDKEINGMIRNIIESNLNRDKISSDVADSSLCHGSSGLLLMYYRLQKYFPENKEIENKLNYWFSILEKDYYSKNKFKSFDSDYNMFIKDFTFLNGYAGIGLALLSVYSEEVLNWENLLLINL